MRKDDKQLGFPTTVFKDTKTNIEALGDLVSGEIAFDTVHNAFGFHDGTNWIWFDQDVGTGSSPSFAAVLLESDPTAKLHAATKQYVDMAVAASTWNFFLSDDISDVTGSYYMYDDETSDPTTELTTPSLSAGNDQLLWSFVTESGFPGVDQLTLGVYVGTIFMYKTGTKTVNIYWKLFKRTTGGVETELMTSELSDDLTLSRLQYVLSSSQATDIIFDPTDRVVLKIYANVTSGGSDPTVTISMEGEYDSRIALRVESSAFTNIFVNRDGDTMTGDLTMDGGNIVMADGGTIGQAAGPLLTFDDTNNYLEITGCKVGIGTTSPQRLLHLASTNPKILVEDTDAGVDEKVIYIGVAGSPGGIAFGTMTDAYTAAQHMVIQSTGNVAIGTASAREKLDVRGLIAGGSNATAIANGYYTTIDLTHPSSDRDGARFNFVMSGQDFTLQVASVFGTNDQFFQGTVYSNDGYFTIEAYRAAGLLFSTSGSGGIGENKPIIFSPARTEAMRITSTGNVVIGGTSANGKLHVVGTADDQQFIVQANATQTVNLVEFQNSGGTVQLAIAANGRDFVLDTTTGTKIGTATNQKLGFYNATPVVQASGIADADGTLADITTKFNDLLAKLEAYGLLAVA